MADMNDRYDSRNLDSSETDELKDSYELLDRMEHNVLQAKSMPFSSNCIIDREEFLVLIGMLRDGLPVELKQAKWLLDQSRELRETARQQSTQIVEDAQSQVSQMIDEHEITQQARRFAQETVSEANDEARQIREAAIQYTENRLAQVEDSLTEVLVTVRKHKKDLQG